jgi:cytochrome c553
MLVKALKILGWTAAGIVLLVLAGVASIYIATWRKLDRKHNVPLGTVAKASVAPDTAEGRRLAILVGCLEGCHGKAGGGMLLEQKGVFRLGAPALHNVLREYSDPELVRLLRYGVKRDGRTALLMPAGSFYPMSDADLASITAALRALPPPTGTPQSRLRDLSLVARTGLALGKFPSSVSEVDRTLPRLGDQPRTTALERGRYLASISCTECHGLDFEGETFEGSPSLRILAGYNLDQFKHLLRTGEPVGGRELGLMRQVARDAFVHFRDDELVDIYTYLRAHFRR